MNYIMLSSLRQAVEWALDPEEIEYPSLTLFVFSFPQLPMDPVREGYLFDGWFTEPDGGKEVTTDTQFTSDTKLYAHWDKA
ncbi:MAG: InlB B-repeat-containing protein [Candidatus Methanomethylophilaceae archaeon]|nr:InlB B-repeat-containing protein [Candidatus Methanomethylophilaceae archaeon]